MRRELALGSLVALSLLACKPKKTPLEPCRDPAKGPVVYPCLDVVLEGDEPVTVVACPKTEIDPAHAAVETSGGQVEIRDVVTQCPMGKNVVDVELTVSTTGPATLEADRDVVVPSVVELRDASGGVTRTLHREIDTFLCASCDARKNDQPEDFEIEAPPGKGGAFEKQSIRISLGAR